MAAVPVLDLSGIGPALAAKLNQLGLFTTEDLVRSDRGRLADLLVGASVAQVRTWQAVGELLEVAGMTVPLAEGLHAKGIESLDELANKSLTELRGVVQAMQKDGIPGAALSDDELVAWMKDALLLQNTGTLNGTVTTRNKTAITGVAVTCVGRRAQSDARGRFRIRRLPLGRPLAVHLEHADYNVRTVETDRIAPPRMLLGEQFQLVRKHASSPNPRVLSELSGDRLPALSGARTTLRVQDGEPSPDDLLSIYEFAANGDARAVSRLPDYDAGMVVLRAYRLKPGNFPAGAKLGDHLRFIDGRWQVVTMSRHDVVMFRRRIRYKSLVPPLPANATAADVDRAFRAFTEARRAERGHGPR